MSIQLIATDMDDTLLDGEKRITPRTIEALSRARAAGARIVLCSGRMVKSMLPSAHALDLNEYMIAYNGAAVYDMAAQRVINAIPVEADAARALCRLAEEQGAHVQAYGPDGYMFERNNPFSELYRAHVGIPGRATGRPLSQCLNYQPYKLLIIDSPERIQYLLGLFRARFGEQVNCATSRADFLELTAPKADKGAALAALCARLGVPRSAVCAFGDGLNDMTMLAFAAMGFAMANAHEQVRRAARHIAPPNTEEGVAQVVERLLAQGQIARAPHKEATE